MKKTRKKQDPKPVIVATAGRRLHGLRKLMGLSRPAFCEIVGIDDFVLANIELGKSRMQDEHFDAVCKQFPSFTHWLTYAGDIDLPALKREQTKQARLIAFKIQEGDIPEGFFIREHLPGDVSDG